MECSGIVTANMLKCSIYPTVLNDQQFQGIEIPTLYVVGEKWNGKHTYTLFGDTKTLEGSLSMFLIICAMGAVCLWYYQVPISISILLIVAASATIIEGITPKGLDNLTVSFLASGTYYSLVTFG